METYRRIFISRESRPDSPLENFCSEHGVELVSQPCIQTEVIPDLDFPETDWVFFSSPSGVELYFENYSLRAGKIAALGQGTGKLVQHYGYRADYIGLADNRPSQTGKEFAQIIQENEKVLFPISTISRKSISSQLPEQNKIEIAFYETEIINQEIPGNFSVAILTSPSNVNGFMQAGNILTDCYLLCLGETTEEHIKTHYSAYKNVVNVGTSEENWILKIQELIPLP